MRISLYYSSYRNIKHQRNLFKLQDIFSPIFRTKHFLLLSCLRSCPADSLTESCILLVSRKLFQWWIEKQLFVFHSTMFSTVDEDSQFLSLNRLILKFHQVPKLNLLFPNLKILIFESDSDYQRKNNLLFRGGKILFLDFVFRLGFWKSHSLHSQTIFIFFCEKFKRSFREKRSWWRIENADLDLSLYFKRRSKDGVGE